MSRAPLARTSVRDAIDSALIALTAAGIDTPRLDAELLLADAMGVSRAAIVADPRLEIDPDAARTFQDSIRRRTRREPVAYILGHRGFRRLDLVVDDRVLVPRPETEHLVEAALTLPHGARVVDVGTGSGAIALALKDERPDLDVIGTDISAGALAVARANGERLGLDVQWREGDLLAGIDRADAVVSNPPYVPTGAQVDPEIGHEPQVAVWAGTNPLQIYERLAPAALSIGARFMGFEVGMGLASAVADLLLSAGYTETETHDDLAGIRRVVVGRR
jgi:release factor glutamine methyltransferase